MTFITSPKAEAAVLLLLSISALARPQDAPQNAPQPADPNKLVEINGFSVKGTRLPADSIVRLSGLKVGQKVNYAAINNACHRITSTGLVKMIEYSYDTYPGKPGVVLAFNLVDELPLLPAKIMPPQYEQRIWQCLQSADPIFTRELPNTENALKFYSANIERCLKNQGYTDEQGRALVTCDGNGNSIDIVFNIRHTPPAK